MCVCVLRLQDNSNAGWVWRVTAVCAQASLSTQLAALGYLCAMRRTQIISGKRCNGSLTAAVGKSTAVCTFDTEIDLQRKIRLDLIGLN